MISRLNMKIDWLALFLIIVPTFWVVNIDLRLAQANMFHIGVFAMIAFLHVNQYIKYFLLYVLAQYLIFPQLPISFFQIECLFMGALAYHMIVKYVEPERLKFYLWIMLGFLAFNCFWALLQAWNIDPVFSLTNPDKQADGFSAGVGFLGLPAMFGNYAAAMVPIALLLMPVSVGFCLIALWLAKSTFSVIAAVLAGAFFLWFKKRIMFWAVMIFGGITILCYVAFTDMPSGQFNRRFAAWHQILIQAFKTQWIGKGFGSLSTAYCFSEVTPTHIVKMTNNERDFVDFVKQQAVLNSSNDVTRLLSGIDITKLKTDAIRPDVFASISEGMQHFNMDVHCWKEAHNEFIQVLFETGLIGLFLMIAYVWDMFRRFYLFGTKSTFCITMASCFLAIVIVSIGHFPFHVARLAVPFLTIAAFFELGLLRAENP